MKSPDHRRSEELASHAEVLLREGRVADARDAYLRACEHEERALAAVPLDKRRTRGILAVSAVALAYKAAAHDHAARLAERWLADEYLPEFAREQLQTLRGTEARAMSEAAVAAKATMERETFERAVCRLYTSMGLGQPEFVYGEPPPGDGVSGSWEQKETRNFVEKYRGKLLQLAPEVRGRVEAWIAIADSDVAKWWPTFTHVYAVRS